MVSQLKNKTLEVIKAILPIVIVVIILQFTLIKMPGIQKKQKLLGICIEPEKEAVLSVTYPDKKEAILEEIVRAAELEKPGAGIAFVVPVEKVVGVVHLLGRNP